MNDSADRHMSNRCREVVGNHCHCTLEYNMPEGTRRTCMVCEPEQHADELLVARHGIVVAIKQLAYEAAMQDAWAEVETEQDDPAYLAWCEEQDAIHEGRATELVECVMCLPISKRFNLGAELEAPLRGVLRRYTTKGFDPSEVLVLSCKHEVL
jgi:hypothetical protein